MKVEEIEAFADAYQCSMAYLPINDVRVIALMLSQDMDEDEIYDRFPEATTVIDAYLLWGAAKEFAKGEMK